jgi:hypothetical protein
MTALSENRKTKERDAKIRSYTVLDEEIIYAGGMVQLNTSSGEVDMASDTASRVVVGVARKYVDNSDDGETVEVKTGCFLFENDDTNPVTNASVGAECYVKDDNTVCAIAGASNNNVAGTVFEVASDGVWVDINAYVAPAAS